MRGCAFAIRSRSRHASATAKGANHNRDHRRVGDVAAELSGVDLAQETPENTC
jgi:hypothetical protein